MRATVTGGAAESRPITHRERGRGGRGERGRGGRECVVCGGRECVARGVGVGGVVCVWVCVGERERE